jgi:hypothetical protein
MGPYTVQQKALTMTCKLVAQATILASIFGCQQLMTPVFASNGHTTDQSEKGSLSSEDFDLLSRNEAAESDGRPIGSASLGHTVIIKGFAVSLNIGAVVKRQKELAFCDGLSEWPTDIEGSWVSIEGKLLSSDVDPNEKVSFWGGSLPAFRVRPCVVTVGARELDILDTDRKTLINSGLVGTNPRLGEVVSVKGQLIHSPKGHYIRSNEELFRLNCDRYTQFFQELGVVRTVVATGLLGYEPPLYLPNASPTDLVRSATPDTGRFTIDHCKLSLI